MTGPQLVGCALVVIGGFGGLANALAWMSIVEALNVPRPSDDQIPVYTVTWQDFRKYREIITRHGFFSQWKLLKEFHLRFPENNLYYWYIGGFVWMFSFFAIGMFIMATGK